MNFDWERDYHGNLEWLPSNTILLVKHGSHAYGLNTPESDLDVKGVAIPPREYFFGFLKKFEQAEFKPPDTTIFDIRKFFQLAADCNPNIIEVLWVDDSDVIYENGFGAWLRDIRKRFLSQKAKYTFSGYAIAQLKRIKTHRKWLLSPREKQPTRTEFSLPETSLLSADMIGAIQSVLERGGSESQYSENVMEIYQRERAYHNAMTGWQQYQLWKKNRNPARAALEAKMGFDGKHAAHLVRLMRACREILTTGEVVVKRPDREEILAIRNGAWTYDQLIEWAERQDADMDELLKTSTLPHAPDRNYLDGQCRAMIEGVLHV